MQESFWWRQRVAEAVYPWICRHRSMRILVISLFPHFHSPVPNKPYVLLLFFVCFSFCFVFSVDDVKAAPSVKEKLRRNYVIQCQCHCHAATTQALNEASIYDSAMITVSRYRPGRRRPQPLSSVPLALSTQ